MRSKVERQSEEAEKAVRDIRRATRRHFSAEDKVRIVVVGLRGLRGNPREITMRISRVETGGRKNKSRASFAGITPAFRSRVR